MEEHLVLLRGKGVLDLGRCPYIKNKDASLPPSKYGYPQKKNRSGWLLLSLPWLYLVRTKQLVE